MSFNPMSARTTSDYSPLPVGSRAYNQAVQARREMMGWFAAITPRAKRKPRRTRAEIRAAKAKR